MIAIRPYVTKLFQKTPPVADVSASAAFAKRFSMLLERLPIGIEPGSLLAGDFGPDYLPAPERDAVAARLNERSRPSAPDPEPPADMDQPELMAQRFGIRAGITIGHASADYARVIEQGVEGIIADVARPRANSTPEQLDYRRAMAASLEAVVLWAERYAALAEQRAEGVAPGPERERLLQIARACRRVPRLPAQNFLEAVQSFWFTHAAAMISEIITWDSMSPGRMDQYLWPCFCRDIERGVPETRLEAMLDDLWAKFARYCVANHNVNIGGVDAHGGDAFNDLSALILRVAKKKPRTVPLLSVRVHPGMRKEDFRLAADPSLMKTGQPTFYGEEACRKALLKRGVAPEELSRFAAGSCMALVVQGREYSGMWDVVINALTPLELALNAGQPFSAEFPLALTTPPNNEYRSIDELVDQWARYLSEIADWCVERSATYTREYGRHCPNPFLSALIGCIDSGKDRSDFGAPYHCSTCDMFGLVNAADSLTAIETLVFKERRFTLAELVAAARANFEGHADAYRAISQCPKYGNDDEQADAMAARLAGRCAAVLRAHDHDNVHYLPSFHTLHGHIDTGRKTPASLDGRLTGEPLAKNVGTVPGRAHNGLTALLLSATRIDQSEFSGGQALDIVIDGALLHTPAGVDQFRALMETYFARGGLQLHVNTVSAEELRAAIKHPKQHRDRMVRVAGYSARFVNLEEKIQHDLLARFER